MYQESFKSYRRMKANIEGLNTITDITCMHVHPRQHDLFVESESVFIRPNKLVGAYHSSEEYIDVQFRLLMEDVLRPLRQDIRRIKQHRRLDNHFRNVRISTGHSSGDTFEVRAFKTLFVPLQQNRLQEIDWEDRSIFLSGSLVILSPDNFRTVKCAKVVDIAKIPNEDSFFLFLHVIFLLDGPAWTIHNKVRFQMIESKAFFQPYEYTLNFLQTVDFNVYPMKKYVVDAVTKSEIAPHLLKESVDKLDLSVLMNENTNQGSYVHPLDYQNWPSASELNLDPSQFEALQKAITQELTIIQGPPGTGKSHISLQIVKLLLANQWLVSSPVLIVAYTNNALDQLLEPILKFLTDKIHGGDKKNAEKSLLRFGGGCESENILPCTMNYKRQKFQEKRQCKKQIISLDKALFNVRNLQFSTKLVHQGILNFKMVPQIMLAKLIENEKSKDIFILWTKYERHIENNVFSWFGLNGQPLELRKKSSDGLFLLLCNNLLSILNQKFPYIPMTAEELKDKPLYNQNLEQQYKIRWGYYFFLVGELADIVEKCQNNLNAAIDASKKLEHYVKENQTLKQAKIIAMTTTGAIKYKQILQNILKPKIMLVEEAAHVLEAYVIAALTRHCTQLILIGDHKQLRPLIADYDLCKDFLDVSLMERLVKNGIAQNAINWTQLELQHRMRPEIARLICPVIYNKLDNHPDVEKYPNVAGCLKNLFFIHHENPEKKVSKTLIS